MTFIRYVFLALLAACLTLPATAQRTTPPEPPVRYDADLLPPAFHESRRVAVLEALPKHGVAVFFSSPVRVRENDVDYEYRQDSDLYYLTGTTEPGTILLLAPGGIEIDGTTTQELLLVPPRNAYSEVWVGRRFGADRAQTTLGVEKAVSNERFGEVMAKLAAEPKRRFFHLPLPEGAASDTDLGRQLDVFTSHVRTLDLRGNFLAQNALRLMLSATTPERFTQAKQIVTGRLAADDFDDPTLREAYAAFVDAPDVTAWQRWQNEKLEANFADAVLLRDTLTRLRMVKTQAEMVVLQRAIDITTAAHREAMRSIEPGMHEYEVEALVEYIFRRNGAQDPGFPSIVASGENATILHYNTNRRPMTADDLVVIDIGAEVHGDTADVTRTLPVDGTFSDEQRAIYQLVLEAQQAGIEAAQAGRPYMAPGQAATRIIEAGLRELGLLQSGDDVRAFFMHGTSHYLGLYVHDVGDYGPLQPGQVITVEPGIYISPSPDVDPKWWHIGVRIEDDILITEDGPVNLSQSAPRAPAAVEALMRERGLGNEPAGLEGTH